MSNNCSITLNSEVFPICDFGTVCLFKFPVLNKITFSCDVICAPTIQEPFNFFTCLVAGKIDGFVDNSGKSVISNTLALPCAFSFTFPFPFLSIFLLFPEELDVFWDDCSLPFCGCFPPGQWFWVVWFNFPHLAHFWPQALHSWELVEGQTLSKCLSLSSRLFLEYSCWCLSIGNW